MILRGVTWRLKVVEPPEAEPLSVAFVRDNHLRSPNGGGEDAYLTPLIAVARRMFERYSRRAGMPRTLALVMSGFPSCGAIELPKPPLREVTSITYIDAAGVQQTWAPSDYVVSQSDDDLAVRATILPAPGKSYPATRHHLEAVRVTYECGYASANDIPEIDRQGMLLVISELYKQRSESVHAMNQSAALIRARDLWARVA